MKTLLTALVSIFFITLTAEDVTRIYQIQSRTGDSNPSYPMVPYKNKLYFIAQNGDYDRQIWSCDSNNTVNCITSLNELPKGKIIVYNDKLYFFTGPDSYSTKKLWEFNGINQPEIIFDGFNYKGLGPFTVYAGKLYYYIMNSDYKYELWIFDGKNRPQKFANGSTSGSSNNNPTLTLYKQKLYFVSTDSINGNELWCCDSVNPPYMVKDINSGSSSSDPQGLFILNDQLYFTANDGAHGNELWEFNGKTPPKMIGDINEGFASSIDLNYYSHVILHDILYFIANGSNGKSVWKYDGINPPEEYKNFGMTPKELFVFKEKLFALMEISWYYNIYLLEEGNIALSHPVSIGSYTMGYYSINNDTLFFTNVDNQTSRCSLYRYDGFNTPVNIPLPFESNPYSIQFIPLNGNIYFRISGRLWKFSNDSLINISGNFPEYPIELGIFYNKYYYLYNEPLHGSEIWSFNGIDPSSIVYDINKKQIIPTNLDIKIANNNLYFTYTDNTKKYIEYNDSVFKTLSDKFNPVSVYNALNFKNCSYYIKGTGMISMGLFKYDGVNTTFISGAPRAGLSVMNDTIYYAITDDDLYKYDGITSPVKVADIPGGYSIYQNVFKNKLLLFILKYPGYDTAYLYEYDEVNKPRLINKSLAIDEYSYNLSTPVCTEYNGKFYYEASDAKYGTELWEYDGVNIPIMVADIDSGMNGSSPQSLVVFKDKLYFSAYNSEYGRELWSYDGVNDPEIVADIVNGPSSSSPCQLIVSNNKLYFTATNSLGTELWSYDGITQPSLVSDINFGSKSSYPKDLVVYNDHLFLSAVTENEGRQLYRVCNNCSSTDTAICESYNFNERILKTSGRYYDTIPGVSGNDSIIILNLTILKPKTSSIFINSCDHFKFLGNTLTESGTYYDTIPNYEGCDSIITIHLAVNHSTYDTISPVVCETYTSPSGKKYTFSGTYFDTIPSSCGCDSILTINLTVNHNTTATQQVKTCNDYASPSGKYVWEQSGTYLDTIPNACGCDSIIKVELNLQHIDPTVSLMLDGAEIVSNDILAHHQWVDCDEDYKPIASQTGQSFTPTQSGNYAVIVSYGWCADTSECIQVSTTGMEPNTPETGIKIYPNPTSGKFSIDLGREYEEAVITISELDGRLVLAKKAENTQRIELNFTIPNGIYFINVSSRAENQMFRLLKL